MSPQPPRDDEQDFLEDFVLEEDTPIGEDELDNLFAPPQLPLAAAALGPADGDAEDLLFAAPPPTAGEPVFASAAEFAEAADAPWEGADLGLEDLGIRAASQSAAAAGGDAGQEWSEPPEALPLEEEFDEEQELQVELVEEPAAILEADSDAIQELAAVDSAAMPAADGEDWRHSEPFALVEPVVEPVAEPPAAISADLFADEAGASEDFAAADLAVDAELTDAAIPELPGEFAVDEDDSETAATADQGESDWVLDEEQELEIVGAEAAELLILDGETAEVAFDSELPAAAEFGDPFPGDAFSADELLAETAVAPPAEATDEWAAASTADDGQWQEIELGNASPAEVAEAAAASADWQQAAVLPGETGGYETIEASDAYVGEAAVADNFDDAGEASGWEPLPSASMAELGEVAEPAYAEEPAAVEAYPAESIDLPATANAGFVHHRGGVQDDDDNAELYVEHEEATAAVVGGLRATPARRGRVAAAAAAALLLAAGTSYLLWPEWFRPADDPTLEVVAQVPRPALPAGISPPPMPEPRSVVVPGVSAVVPAPEDQPAAADQPVERAARQPEPVAAQQPAEPAVVAADPDPAGAGVAATEPAAVPTASRSESPLAGSPASGKAGPADPAADLPQWPVAGNPVVVRQGSRSSNPVRIDERDAMILHEEPEVTATAVDGMLPGSRAFAQLHNGNYFIGNLKLLDDDRVTLRLQGGEVTLPRESIAKLMPLGTADYEELQKVNSGSVRLTNKNRLVGSILSGIADDYVVLEFRSNRVMLPKSAVGEVLAGDSELDLRLATTTEEDDWLRRVVERQLGTGQPAAAKPAR